MDYVVLISGGGGFIGKNLIKYLLKHNLATKIIVIDNFITSDPDYFYDLFNNNDNITCFDFDITDNKLISFIKERFNVINEIYHLASLASPIAYKKYPLKTLDTGYIGTKYMLELALHYNAKFLLASTSEIYGDAQVSPQTENYYGNVNSFGERACYDESKRVAEALVYTYQRTRGIDARIARIFNTYGPCMDINDGRIITEIIKHTLNDTELTIFGDGSQTRSICYVDDTVSMLVKLMMSDYQYPINVGNDNEMSVNEIVRITIEQLKASPKIVYKPLTQNDPLMRRPCLKLNQLILKNTNYTLIEDGIKKTISFFVKNT